MRSRHLISDPTVSMMDYVASIRENKIQYHKNSLWELSKCTVNIPRSFNSNSQMPETMQVIYPTSVLNWNIANIVLVQNYF